MEQNVFVVENLKQALLGRPAIVALDLLLMKANVDEVMSPSLSSMNKVKESFPQLFQPLGQFAGDPYQIRLTEDAKPAALACPRRVGHPLMDKVKAELSRIRKTKLSLSKWKSLLTGARA